jgi:uncharacterized membrane protein
MTVEAIMCLIVVVRFVALLSTGLLAGIFLGYRTGATFALPKLPASSFVQFQQVIHKYYVRVLPILQIMAVLGTLTWLLLLRSSARSFGFVLIALAAAGTVCVFVLTAAFNVPINKKLMTWSASAPPANMTEIWRPWDRVNTVRTILAVGAFAFEVMALSLAAQD